MVEMQRVRGIKNEKMVILKKSTSIVLNYFPPLVN